MTWAGLFDLPLLCERFVRREHMSKPELDYVYISTINNFSAKPTFFKSVCPLNFLNFKQRL